MTRAGAKASEFSDNSELSPLADRLVLLLVVRIFMAATVLFSSMILTDLTVAPAAKYLSLVYVGLAVGSEFLHRWLTKVTSMRWIVIVNAMLIIDGLFVAAVLAGSGQSRSPFMFLAYAHIVSVTLLVGFRTGLKMAAWHSILLLSVYYLGLSGNTVFNSITGVRQVTDEKSLGSQLEVAQATALWLVAIVTATFSGLNERELRRRKGELTIIADLASEIERTRRPSEILSAMNQAAVEKLNAVRSVALVMNGGSVLVVGDDAKTTQTIEVGSMRELGGNIEGAVNKAKPLTVRMLDPEKDKLLIDVFPNAENVAIVPMIAEGESLGVLVVEWGLHARARVTRATIDLLSNVAGRVALSLSNTFLLAEVQRLASVDGLTNLANRRTFNITIEREVKRALRLGTPLSLVILDIDHFKNVNDTYGHQVGDQVIAESAAGVANACRQTDVPARYGGEEIVVIMPDCNAEEALMAAERIRVAMATANTTLPGITASAGVSTLVEHAMDAESLLAAADAALYRAKEDGRNNLKVAARRDESSKTPAPVAESAAVVEDQLVEPKSFVFE